MIVAQILSPLENCLPHLYSIEWNRAPQLVSDDHKLLLFANDDDEERNCSCVHFWLMRHPKRIAISRLIVKE